MKTLYRKAKVQIHYLESQCLIYDKKKWQSADLDRQPNKFVFQTICRFCYIPFYKIHAYSTVGINNSHTNKNKNKNNGKNWLVIHTRERIEKLKKKKKH